LREAATHAWLDEFTEAPERLDVDVLKQLAVFSSESAFKRAIFGLMAYSFAPRSWGSSLGSQFLFLSSMDENSAGSIHADDLTKVLGSVLRFTHEESQRIVAKLDLTGSNSISYSEFLAAVEEPVLSDSAMALAFAKLDADQKGFIDASDLRCVLGDRYCGVAVEDMITAVDTDIAGRMSFNEFLKALSSPAPKPGDPQKHRSILPQRGNHWPVSCDALAAANFV
jgi:Ca2+-binding EF-hand superfamily protein